ncbi:MAG: nuclear transport factor 2 family protein [Acidobacteria bacterium]|nr:nuclear transport factor 2 family protein [Acidobacteriota bacterium]
MTKTFVLALIVLAGIAGSASAQSADQKAVQQVVESFLLRLGDHKFETLAADLTEKALILATRQRAPQWVNTYQTAEEWLAGLKKNPSPVTFREPLSNIKVTIDGGHLAFLRADFQVVRDGKVQSTGVDEFTLVREASGWKIVVVAYTSIPAPR